MATYNDIKKIKIGDNVFVIHVPTASEVGALPSSTTIPTKTSQLTNDSGFITADTNTTYTLSGALSSHKFTSTLTAGGSGSGTSTSALTLAAGSNVTLTDNTSTKTITIAATDTKYSAGDGLSLSSTTFSSLNSNLVNGSSAGSVRGINAAAEDSSYTMGINAFAEGSGTKASGSKSHAEGDSAEASGLCSHAEGYGTIASGRQSHAQNYGTITQGRYQTAIGRYNIAQGSGSSSEASDHAFIIGNGAANDARSNALTVDWSGNVDIASGAKYKIGGTALSASDVGAMPTTTLLWTNSSPTSSFTAKTVSLSLSAYSAIEIEFKHASSSNSFLYQKFKIPSDDMSLFYMTGKGTYFELESRAVTVTTSGVTFADGRRAQATWTASSDNIRCIPTRIFGIK